MNVQRRKEAKFIGSCQICEGDFKLRNDRMVHHGYKRPGNGYIVGDCPGVHEVPYEVSCELVKTVLEIVKSRLAEDESRLAKYVAREVAWFLAPEVRWSARSPLIYYVVGVTEPMRFLGAVEDRITDTKTNIYYGKREVERLTKRVENWTPKKVRESK